MQRWWQEAQEQRRRRARKYGDRRCCGERRLGQAAARAKRRRREQGEAWVQGGAASGRCREATSGEVQSNGARAARFKAAAKRRWRRSTGAHRNGDRAMKLAGGDRRARGPSGDVGGDDGGEREEKRSRIEEEPNGESGEGEGQFCEFRERRLNRRNIGLDAGEYEQ